MIHVTQPSLAPLDELMKLLEGVWERGILTHNGPLVQELERQLCARLGLDHFVAVSNGTIALQMAIRALGLRGEIITSPFTWVATVSAIKWEGCTPVFCDIDPETFNLDPAKLSAAITPQTVGIMPVHVFGNPCDVGAIADFANAHGLKVVYDAAHAIGSTLDGRSLLSYGDIAATSLHATKLLNTAEGGGCITSDPELAEKLRRIRFFGHDRDKNIVEDGFNGKMTEIHAALGLANLKYYEEVLADRKAKYLHYFERLSVNPGLTFQKVPRGEPNYSYFPVVFPNERLLLAVEAALIAGGYTPRRYFYPSVNTFERIVHYSSQPVSESLASRILCLPLYWKLAWADCDRIAEIVLESVARGMATAR